MVIQKSLSEIAREEGSVSALMLAGFNDNQISKLLNIPIERIQEIKTTLSKLNK